MTEQSVLTRTSILPPEMSGVMFLSGYRGSGKSFLASQSDLPDNILFLDFESKGAGINAQLDFGSYRALTQEAGEDPQALYRVTIQAINDIPDNRYTVAIFDNVSPFEIAMNAEAANDARMYSKRYGLNEKNVKAGRFGGTKSIVNFMISDICSKLHSKGIRLIVPTSHISARWSTTGPIPNKYSMKGADRWQELSILTLILIPGDKPPVPSALVQKEQLGTISIDYDDKQLEAIMHGEAGHTVKRRLPPKISECTFQKIRWYLHNPADFENLADHEVPTLEERDPFDKTLSKEQLGVIMAELDYQKAQEVKEKSILEALAVDDKNKIVDKILLQLSGLPNGSTSKPLPAIKAELDAKGHIFSIPDIANAVAEFKKES